ncbi:MAG: hypothetical protein SFU98_10880 [Leptospiraceae bacterium]|nr:hypothetical protein [Leptospiraceae bacterium]
MKKLTLVAITVLSTGFMFLPNGMKWNDILYGRFPEISFKINPNAIGTKMGTEEEILNQVKESSLAWSFKETGAAVAFVYKGKTNSNPQNFDLNICSSTDRSSVKSIDNTIYFQKEENADCTSESCGYVWSCADNKEVIHFDVAVNNANFHLESGSALSKAYRIGNIFLKQLGVIAGLYHCSPGVACDAGDPDSSSAVYKFLEPENYNTRISLDDSNGLKALYGELNANEKTLLAVKEEFKIRVASFCTAPCVLPEQDTGTYQPSARELSAWDDYIQDRAKEGMETRPKQLELYKDFENSYTRSYRVSGISAEQYMMDSITYDSHYLVMIPSEMFDGYLQNLFVDLKNRERSLLFKNELDPNYVEFVETELKALIQIRRRFIDEKNRR